MQMIVDVDLKLEVIQDYLKLLNRIERGHIIDPYQHILYKICYIQDYELYDHSIGRKLKGKTC